jgi:hypothetical protein
VHRRGRLIAGVGAASRNLALAVLLAAAACAGPTSKPQEAAPVPTAQRQAAAHVERMRTIRAAANPGEARKFNAWLDEAWKFFLANPKDAVPVLRRELAAEMARKPRNDFLLLDLGYFLHEHGEARDRAPAREALLALDPDAPVMRFNEQELFEFTHAAASDGDARVLGFIDRAYLRTPRTLELPLPPAPGTREAARPLALDATGLCVALYGSYGPGAEAHLRRLLGDAALRKRVLEVLIWIGSPDSNADVRSAMLAAARDYETFVRAATFLIRAGGPQGRFFLLGVSPAGLDAKTREYYAKIRKPVAETTFAQLAKPFETEARARLPDDEMKRRLAAMNSGYGSGVRVPPQAILHSSLPREFLIEQLARAREQSLRRLTGSSLADVQLTDALLNALYYREK